MMTPEQFEAEKKYLAAREIAEGFLKKGLLTADEFDKIDAFLAEKFSPLMGKLIAETGTNLLAMCLEKSD